MTSWMLRGIVSEGIAQCKTVFERAYDGAIPLPLEEEGWNIVLGEIVVIVAEELRKALTPAGLHRVSRFTTDLALKLEGADQR